MVQWIADLVGLPADQIRVIVTSVLLIPLSYIMPLIHDSSMRKAYSVAVGTLLQFYVYGEYPFQLFLIISHSALVYYLVTIRRSDCGPLATYGSIGFLALFHLYRQITDYGSWTLDTTTLLMMHVCKYSSFAYACQDGASEDAKLSEEQRQLRLTKIPSFYDYICYLQFLPSSVMGPTLEYVEYHQYIHAQGNYQSIPDRLHVMKKVALESLVMLVLYLGIYSPFVPISYMATEEFLSRSCIYILFYAWISVTLLRTKYYFAWKLSMCSVHASGLSYNGGDDWSKINTCNPQIVESTIHVKDKIGNWNMSVQKWLRRCIYLRYRTETQYKTDKSSQMRGQLLVFAISAFWHGFYGGYYISFFFWFCQIYLAQLVFKTVENVPEIKEKYRSLGKAGEIGLWLLCNVMFSYFGAGFQLLSIHHGWGLMKSMWFVPEILLLVSIVGLQKSGLPFKKKRPVEAAKEQKAA